MTPAYAVLFKCHYWDNFIRRQLQRLSRQVGAAGAVYVVVDETSRPVPDIDYPPDRVLRVSRASVQAIGLEHAGATPVFWLNNDYPLHAFSRIQPDYQYYAMLEFDVVMNVPLDAVIQRLADEAVDFVGEPIRTPLADWPWRAACDGWYPADQIRHWLTCAAFFSNRAAHHLYQRRVATGQRLRSGEMTALPMCEAAIPTELSLGGFRMMPLHDLGPANCYDAWPPFPEQMLAGLEHQAFVHPVLDTQRFVESLVRGMPNAAGLLDPGHPYRNRLSLEALALALPYIHRAAWQRGDDVGCAQTIAAMRLSADRAYLQLHGLDDANLALGKAASVSSSSEWSPRPDDARGPVLGPVTGGFSFHTALEEQPWWMVDLLTQQDVGLVRVFNRMDLGWRANGLQVFVSADGRVWDLAGCHADGVPFGGADGQPLEISVNRRVRFVRLELPGTAMLHLDQVQVLRAQASVA